MMDAALRQRLAYLFKAFEQAMHDEDVPVRTVERVMNRVMHGDPRGDRVAMTQERMDLPTVQDVLANLPPGTVVTPETGM